MPPAVSSPFVVAVRQALPSFSQGGRQWRTRVVSNTKNETCIRFSEAFENISNARDLAESTERILEGKIFRSGNPVQGTKMDTVALRKTFGVRQMIDLRSDSEYEEDSGWHSLLTGGVLRNYSFANGKKGVLVSSSEMGDHHEFDDIGLPTCELHRFSLLEKKKFIRTLLWKLPFSKTFAALACKMLGYEDKMREILLPCVLLIGSCICLF